MAFSDWFNDPNNQLPDYMPDWLKRTGTLTLPQAPPGQLEKLAGNLAAGGFGSSGANLKYLDQVYDPVVAADFYNPDKTTVPPTTKQPDTKTAGSPPYWVTSSSPMGGNSQKPWWQTGLVNDPRWIKEFGNTRKPKGG